MKKIRTILALLIVLGFISTLVGGVGYVYGNPDGVTDNFDNESYIASKTNLVVSGGQVKLAQDCSSYGCAEPDGLGGCRAKTAGEQGLAACKRCNGVSLYPVNIASGSQDIEGINVSGTCYSCDGNGNNVARTVDGVLATALGCAAGQEACRRCDAGVCTYYTSGQHGCPAGQECNASGQCVVVVTCGGIEWGGYCWYESAASQSCTSVCVNHGGNVGTCQENDTTGCPLCRTFHPGAPGCALSTKNYTPAYTSSNGQCYRRQAGISGNCDTIFGLYLRFCACNN